jgi:8-oxo-dGTP diphosphatase
MADGRAQARAPRRPHYRDGSARDDHQAGEEGHHRFSPVGECVGRKSDNRLLCGFCLYFGGRGVSQALLEKHHFQRCLKTTIILDDQGRYLLQHRDDIAAIFYRSIIGPFGGHRESNETFLDCAVRELWLLYREFLASCEGPDRAIQGGTVCIKFFVVRNVPADGPVVRKANLCLFQRQNLALSRETHPYHQGCAERLFPKIPRKLTPGRGSEYCMLQCVYVATKGFKLRSRGRPCDLKILAVFRGHRIGQANRRRYSIRSSARHAIA